MPNLDSSAVAKACKISDVRLNQLRRYLKEGTDYEKFGRVYIYNQSAIDRIKARQKKYKKFKNKRK